MSEQEAVEFSPGYLLLPHPVGASLLFKDQGVMVHLTEPALDSLAEVLSERRRLRQCSRRTSIPRLPPLKWLAEEVHDKLRYTAQITGASYRITPLPGPDGRTEGYEILYIPNNTPQVRLGRNYAGTFGQVERYLREAKLVARRHYRTLRQEEVW